MKRFMLQIVSVVSSIQELIICFFTKNDFGFSVTFMKTVSSLKKVFLKCEHGAEF